MEDRFRKQIQRKLATYSPRHLRESHTATAAVLISILDKRGEPHILLTRRTHEVATHKGQVSFPGGMREAVDFSLRETALRETHEEVGIPPDYVEVLGEFDQYMSVTNFLVTPFVGFLREGFTLAANPSEVDRILEVPLEFFRLSEPRRQYFYKPGKRGILYFYDYDGEVIWGLTARMIRDLLALVDE